jgi:hypothetical protein
MARSILIKLVCRVSLLGYVKSINNYVFVHSEWNFNTSYSSINIICWKAVLWFGSWWWVFSFLTLMQRNNRICFRYGSNKFGLLSSFGTAAAKNIGGRQQGWFISKCIIERKNIIGHFVHYIAKTMKRKKNGHYIYLDRTYIIHN